MDWTAVCCNNKNVVTLVTVVKTSWKMWLLQELNIISKKFWVNNNRDNSGSGDSSGSRYSCGSSHICESCDKSHLLRWIKKKNFWRSVDTYNVSSFWGVALLEFTVSWGIEAAYQKSNYRQYISDCKTMGKGLNYNGGKYEHFNIWFLFAKIGPN